MSVPYTWGRLQEATFQKSTNPPQTNPRRAVASPDRCDRCRKARPNRPSMQCTASTRQMVSVHRLLPDGLDSVLQPQKGIRVSKVGWKNEGPSLQGEGINTVAPAVHAVYLGSQAPTPPTAPFTLQTISGLTAGFSSDTVCSAPGTPKLPATPGPTVRPEYVKYSLSGVSGVMSARKKTWSGVGLGLGRLQSGSDLLITLVLAYLDESSTTN
ncbi:hypothetical protein MYCTH_94476 [Thermothelomyces thermophilus ATCC 42464]|uniref:Uncharacterized protein n=1 Tax=Thermothelomyces thermophilus (strain ATCC 42464 / BCRC 31852 / DSM 1799) TaxID=573729 RepID=G2QC24_THET4|nr:uncharacterized protein MYCTH_94476 [Thermothelomyces thermophilus ATCC 42464]AEO57251.1 hypothetical protein MYCTH_94476 [Thermothelomyces thermophilus ATCC 42464]